MIGARKLGKLNSEKFCLEHLQRSRQRQKKLQLQKSQTRQKMKQLQRKMKSVKQPQLKILMGIEHPSKMLHLIWLSATIPTFGLHRLYKAPTKLSNYLL